MSARLSSARRSTAAAFAVSAAALVSLVVPTPALATVPAAAAVTSDTRSTSLAEIAQPAAPAGAVQWSVAPAGPEGADGRISLRHEIAPGGVGTDAIAVTNSGATAATFLVATGDGVVGAEGAFDIAPGEPVDAGAWIAVDGLVDGTLALEPGESVVLPLRIAVPAEATPGDHPAGIVVGLAQQEAGVTVSQRIGVRLHLRVAGEVTPSLAVQDVTAVFEPSWIPFAPGTLTVTYGVANTGNVRLGAAAGVRTEGPFGLLAASHGSGEARELLPGRAASQTVTASAWPLFAFGGSVEVTPIAIGDDTVTLPAVEGVPIAGAAISWTGVALLVLLGGVVVLLVVRRKRRVEAGAA